MLTPLNYGIEGENDEPDQGWSEAPFPTQPTATFKIPSPQAEPKKDLEVSLETVPPAR
jgi:hypothetical protein